ncbi:Hypothetical predicted protein [Mytilus galloprovincialis]|uniref:Endonuclease/exonuclease/phosphatase domain-containing protein n=1 Tax=Mytilus galloprovincialis TaxID=29158 RepID=A0A8B6DKL3_MYTGA|nr:Hypothetical predicted protein [Mytilus galloprovincialis]
MSTQCRSSVNNTGDDHIESQNSQLNDFVPSQEFIAKLDDNLFNLPRDLYIPKLLEMTNDIENTITWYRSILTSRAKSVQGCPTGKLYTRKGTSRSSSTLKYAKDCYILYMFINGDSSGIDEVFRKDESKSVNDQSTVPDCNTNTHSDSHKDNGGKIKHTGPDYTFITKKTMIDYFLVNKSVLRQLRSCEILDEGSISSTSDHLPIIVELLIDNNPHRIMNSYSKFPAWHKINDEHIRNYQDSMDVPIELLTGRINSDNVDVDTVNTEIESILHAAADSVIPKCVFNPYTKPYWTPDVKKAHQTERSMRKRWLADGRPRGMSHESYKHYKKAKYEFRNVQNAAYEQYIQKCYNDINEAAECDIRLFWKLVKRCKPSTSRIYPEIIHNGDTCNDQKALLMPLWTIFQTFVQQTILTLLIRQRNNLLTVRIQRF